MLNLDDLNQFDRERLCNLLECDNTELVRLFDNAKQVFDETKSVYESLLKILQQGNNLREAILIGILCGKHIGFLEAEVTNSHVNRQTLTLSFPNTNRSITNLDYMDGSYYIEVEKFSGSIEKTSQYKDNGQTMIEFSGRSEVRKLLGPVINKNTLHSKDMIYSGIVTHVDLIT